MLRTVTFDGLVDLCVSVMFSSATPSLSLSLDVSDSICSTHFLMEAGSGFLSAM